MVTALMSAWIPAPPPESEPAMIRTRPRGEVMGSEWRKVRWRARRGVPSRAGDLIHAYIAVSRPKETALSRRTVVIVGAGFGGLAAAKALKGADVEVVLIDRTNHHLFQPLLYQVATAALSPADIATASRTLLRGQANVTVLMGEVTAVDADAKCVRL